MKIVNKILAVLFLAATVWAQDEETAPVEAPAPAEEIAPVEEDTASVETAPAEVTPLADEKTPVRVKKTRPPREHRGFFFSAGLGVAYTDISATDKSTGENWYYDENGQSFPKEWEKTVRKEASGWALPALDFKFGKSIANLVVVHGQVDFAVYSATFDYSASKESQGEGVNIAGISLPKITVDEKKGIENIALAFGAGLGFMVYPFRNPLSVMNGFYVGFSSGIDGFVGGFEDNYAETNLSSFFTQYEVGKDWWVSDTWSVGVALAYVAHALVEDGDSEDGGSRNTIKFLVRLTRG